MRLRRPRIDADDVADRWQPKLYLRLIVPCYQSPTSASRAAALGPVPAMSLGLVVGLGLGVQALISHID